MSSAAKATTIPFKVERDGQGLDVCGRAVQSGDERLAAQERAAGHDSSRDHADRSTSRSRTRRRRRPDCKPGDIIRGFNGTRIYNPIALADYIEKHPTDELTLDVQRGVERVRDSSCGPRCLTTEGEKKPRIGIRWDTTGQMSHLASRIRSNRFTTASPARSTRSAPSRRRSRT